jgi:hypothetical protein
MEQRGVQIAHPHGILNGVVTEVVRAAVGVASLETAAGQPARKCVPIVVMAFLLLRLAAGKNLFPSAVPERPGSAPQPWVILRPPRAARQTKRGINSAPSSQRPKIRHAPIAPDKATPPHAPQGHTKSKQGIREDALFGFGFLKPIAQFTGTAGGCWRRPSS